MDLDITLGAVLALLVLLVVIMQRLVWVPLLALLNQRQALTTGRAAEAARLQSEAEADTRRVAERLREARIRSLRAREALRETGRNEQRQRVEAARRALAADRAQHRARQDDVEQRVMAQLQAQIDGLAEKLTQQLLLPRS